MNSRETVRPYYLHRENENTSLLKKMEERRAALATEEEGLGDAFESFRSAMQMKGDGNIIRKVYDPNRKSVLIPWSGGLDSTYLVHDALQKGYNVFVSYLDMMNCDRGKVRGELAARLEALKYFQTHDRYSSGFIHELSSREKVYATDATAFILPQMPYWILHAAALSFGLNTHSGHHNDWRIDEVWMGYIGNDDAISFLKEIQGLWTAYTKFFVSEEDGYPKTPKLVFPLSKKFKHSIAKEMDWELSMMTWSCETPLLNDGACGNCRPCQTRKANGVLTRDAPLANRAFVSAVDAPVATESERDWAELEARGDIGTMTFADEPEANLDELPIDEE